MRSIHRLLSTVLHPRPRVATAVAAPTALIAVGPIPYGASGRIAAAPWEGLYLELDD